MKKIAYFFVGSCFLFLTSCGSSSSPATTTTTTEDTVVVDELSELPSFDLDIVDAAANVSVAPSLSKSLADGNSTLDADSQLGCLTTSYFKTVAVSQLKQIEMLMCYLETTQAADTDLVIPTDGSAFYSVNVGGAAIRVKVNNATADGVTTLGMQACESSDSGTTYAQTIDMEVSGNTSTKTWDGYATQHFQGFEGEGAGFSNINFDVVMLTSNALTSNFDFANVSSFNAAATFGRNPSTSDVASDTTYDDGFQVTFLYEVAAALTSGLLNSVTGSFQAGSGEAQGVVAAKYNASVGAAKMNFSSGGQTIIDGFSEAFDLSSGSAVVMDEEDSTVATIFDTVDALDIASSQIDVPEDVNSAVAFANTVDCSADFASATEIDAASDYSACEAFQAEIESGAAADANACFGEGGGQQDEGDSFALADIVGTYSAGTVTGACQSLTSMSLAVSGNTVTLNLGQGTMSGTCSVSACSVSGSGMDCAINMTAIQSNQLALSCTQSGNPACTYSGYTKQ